MAKSGYISLVQYNLFGGAVGSVWNDLGLTVPSVAINTSYALAVTWQNNGDEDFHGHISVVVTKPDGTTTTLVAASGQDEEVEVDDSNAVVFNPITLDQYGVYTAVATLTETGETTVLDQNSYIVADTGTAPVAGIDLGVIMNLMITLMIVGMMMKMMTRMSK